MKVKICGLQSDEVVESITHFQVPVDYVGFVFAPSKRQITVGQASSWQRLLPGTIESVGVFVNPSLDQLRAVLRQVPLNVVQLHGEEPPEFCGLVKKTFAHIQVWKAWHLTPTSKNDPSMPAMPDIAYGESIDALLLDTKVPQAAGGTGKSFAWELIPSFKMWCKEFGRMLIVAGGIDITNVDRLIQEYGPGGIDVSSGVETDGAKDIDKIAKLLERVKGIV